MNATRTRRIGTAVLLTAAAIGAMWIAPGSVDALPAGYVENTDARQGLVQCANLIYGLNKTSVCFSDEFLAQLQKDSNIRTNRRFCPVKLGSDELFQYPFAVMTGEGAFRLTPAQRANLRAYVSSGGFLVASAGCSSSAWDASFRAEIKQIFPDREFQRLDLSHPIFHTVYDIKSWSTKSHGDTYLEALTIDGRVVLVYSHDGLNDTANAGPGCCCCGGNEIYNARQVNANLLAYALTH